MKAEFREDSIYIIADNEKDGERLWKFLVDGKSKGIEVWGGSSAPKGTQIFIAVKE
jgi:outer membrane protein assembly factor BamB